MLVQLAALSLLATTTLAQEAPMPELELRWRPHRFLTWKLLAPPGEHLSVGSDVLLVVDLSDGQSWDLTGPAEALETGWPNLPVTAPVSLHGTMTASLCTDDGSSCRPVYMAVDVTLDKPRGKLRWTPPQGSPPHLAPERAPTLGYEDALALAAEDGKPLLLDFSAQWCPPCQTLAAEVLHAPEHDDALAELHLVVLDADDPGSWSVKDRYTVGGYPTVIVTDAEGYELARLVGYTGADAFLAWLTGAAGRGDSLGARLKALRALDLDRAQAAQLALDLVRADRVDAAREALERADDSEPAMRALLVLDNHPDALRWLLEHRMGDVRTWLWDGLDAMRGDPALAEELRPALAEAARGAEPIVAAEIMAFLAELAAPEDKPTLYLAAAEALTVALSEDPAHNRGLWAELAWMLREAGAYDQAIAVLDEAIGHYPDEFGYHASKAKVLVLQERWQDAEVEARTALEHAYGDQGLRAVAQLAGILLELGRPAEGLEAIDAVLADFPVPEDDLEVRTHRYLGQVEAVRAELEGVPAQP